MTLIFVDSFDHYVGADTFRKYEQVNLIAANIVTTAADTRFGTGGAMRFTGGGNYCRKLNQPTSFTYIAGLAMNGLSYSTGWSPFAFMAADTNHVGIVRTVRTGQGSTFQVYRGNGVVELTPRPTFVLGNNRWYWVECKYFDDLTVGTVEIRVDGVTVFTFTGNTRGQAGFPGITGFSMGDAGSGGDACDIHIDDLYVATGDATAPNDFLGEKRIYCLFPSGVGATTNFTKVGADATNWQAAKDNDGDTNYVVASTVGDTDLYTFDDLPAAVNTVDAVQWTFTARKEDAGTRLVRGVQRIGGVTSQSATTGGVQSAYQVQRVISRLSLDGGIPWTPTEINTSEFGVRVA